MKIISLFCILFALGNGLFSLPLPIPEESDTSPLTEIYRNGKIEFVPIQRIDGDLLEEPVTFKLIKDITLNKNNDLFVSDVDSNNIKIFSSTGTFLRQIGQKGQGPSDLFWPSYLCYNGKSVIVWEDGNNRLSFFSDSGNFEKIVKPSSSLNIKKIRTHPKGYIIVESEKGEQNPGEGQVCLIDLYSDNFVFIKTIYKQIVSRSKYLTEPIKINISMPYQPDVSWDISPGSNIIIGYQKDYEIFLYTIDEDKPRWIKHPYKPVKITGDDKKDIFDSYRVVTGPGKYKDAPKELLEKIPFPTYRPAFGEIVMAPGNNIWVFPPRVKATKICPYFDLFDENGHFMKRMEINPGFKLPDKIIFDNSGMIWALSYEDSAGFVLTKYKIKR